MLCRKDKSEVQRSAGVSRNDIQTCEITSRVPFSLPLPDPINIHMQSHKPVEISQENKNVKPIQQTDVLFPSAQSIPSINPSDVLHAINPSSKSGEDPYTSNLIWDATNEKELYHSPKETTTTTTAPKRVLDEPRKSSESPKRLKRKRRKEKKMKRKKDSSDEEDDSSECEDSKEDKKSSQDKEKDNDEVEVLLFKRESLMKRVKLLVEQKNMMSNQREDIISNHKGSKASLSSILEENSFLSKEIGKQIGNISNIVKNINQDIEIKRGNFKQKTSVTKDNLESPHVSSRYSGEKERITKKTKPTERSEVYSRSPSPLSHFKQDAEQRPKDRDNINSRSPKAIRHNKRSRSPSSNPFREVPKPVPPPEMKQSCSPPRKRPVKSTIEVTKKSGSHTASQHQSHHKSIDSSMQYAPHEAQRTYIQYTDQGMHWCKLCSLFCETAPEYITHLMSESHMARVKVSVGVLSLFCSICFFLNAITSAYLAVDRYRSKPKFCDLAISAGAEGWESCCMCE